LQFCKLNIVACRQYRALAGVVSWSIFGNAFFCNLIGAFLY
jgi:hypothetical protein